MGIAIALILLALGSVLFHFLSPWYFTPIASNWHTIDTTISITFWVTGFVFVALSLFMGWAVIRYRHRADSRASYQPENKKLEWWLLVVTAGGVAAMLAPGLLVWADIIRVPQEAQVVEAVAQQWHWMYRLPGADGKLGTVHSRFVSDENPFGMNPADTSGNDDVLLATPELHVPLGKPVKVLLRSKDVLHNFSIAQLRVKMDLVPGLVTYTWFTPTRTGSFDLLCEELCGVAHFAMRGRVVVDEEPVFREWLAKQPTFSQTAAQVKGDAEAGKALFATCSACHGENAQGNKELGAPKLAGQDGWYLARQLHSFKQGVRGSHENDTYGKQMIPFASMLADETAVQNIVAYIGSLPDTRPDASVGGNPERGRKLYATCASCHGDKGQGVWGTNAPRLAGMSDWYLARQLENFRQGIRGTHPQDFHGAQMRSMARALKDEESINDLLDYIHTL
jgi:cytochrome c oxidase subunit II